MDNPHESARSLPAGHLLEVYRIEPGEKSCVRLLSDEYGGLFTHWARGRSSLCLGNDCPPAFHRVGTTWKGYAAVQVWDAPGNKWIPAVLEITEHLELEFRGRFRRGQIWELSRAAAASGKKHFPVFGVLRQETDGDRWPVAFRVDTVLRRLYHVAAVDLSAKNPLPPKLYVEASEGDGPAHLAAARAPTAEETADFRRKVAEAKAKLGREQ